MNALLPHVQQLLAQYREFYPFGAAMAPDGEMRLVAIDTGEERPATPHMIELLEGGFQDGAKGQLYKATAIAVDVRTTPPGQAEMQDAVEIRLDHSDGYSVKMILPYTFSPSGELELGAPFAAAGERKIFGR